MFICICNQREFKSDINKHCKLPGKFYFLPIIFLFSFCFCFCLVWFWLCFMVLHKNVTEKRMGFSACYVVLGTSEGKQGAARKVPVGRGRGRKGT